MLALNQSFSLLISLRDIHRWHRSLQMSAASSIRTAPAEDLSYLLRTPDGMPNHHGSDLPSRQIGYEPKIIWHPWDFCTRE